MHGLVALFLEVIVPVIILLVIGCCSSRPCRCVKGNHGSNCLNDDSRIVDHCGCVSCFDGSRNIYNCDVDGSLIHGYVQQEVEPFSFPLAACPW
jgi:hypothetical protein